MSVSQDRLATTGLQARSHRAGGHGQRLLVAAAGLLAVGCIAQSVATGVVAARSAIAFAALIALGELLRLNLPGDREAAPIGTACALAYALLIRVGSVPARHSAFQVVAVTGVGMALGVLPHLAVGRPARTAGMASRLLAVACTAFVFRPLAGTSNIVRHWWAALAVMTVLVTVAWLVDVVIAACTRADTLRGRLWVTFTDELRVQGLLGVAVGASALLIAFAAEAMGLVAVAVFLAPLLVTQVAFRRYAGIRATYLQTVRALARVTEIGGYVETGHADRVSRLAVAVGRELGMAEPELLELQYAALVHDIGQLSLQDPIPGGATVLVSPEDQRRIAELGAEVIQQATMLDSVAEIVRRQSDPCGGTSRCPSGPLPGTAPGEDTDAGERPARPPLSSRIIRAVNAFDDLVGSSADPARAAVVLDRLRLDTSAEYDPAVVAALGRIITRLSVVSG
ncbi:MAG: HD domain-containing protein [Streptosporangiaceae bacterium]